MAPTIRPLAENIGLGVSGIDLDLPSDVENPEAWAKHAAALTSKIQAVGPAGRPKRKATTPSNLTGKWP